MASMPDEATPRPRFRPWRASDRAAGLALFASNVPAFFDESERADFSALLDAPPPSYTLMHDAAGEALGCGGYAFDAHAPEIVWLCWGMVRGDLHGRGLGSALLRHRLMRIAAEPAAREVRIETSQRGEGFFARHGFIARKRVIDGFARGYDLIDMAFVLPETH